MIFPPKDKRKVVTPTFPSFKLDNMDLKFVSEFKYLGHFVTNDEHDDKDVLREVRAMFTHTNILARGFFRVLSLLKLYFFEHFVFVFMVRNSGSTAICALLTDYDLAI